MDFGDKKAQKQYRKSIKGNQSSASHSADWSPFRQEEKKYKRKFPPPDLSDVLDLAALVVDEDIHRRLYRCRGTRDAVQTREISMRDPSRRAFVVPQLPGLILLPSFVQPDVQRELIVAALRDHASSNETNLHAHYNMPAKGLWDAHLDPQQPLVVPRWSTTSSEDLFDVEREGPRLKIDNEPTNVANLVETLALPKLPPRPSQSARDATAKELLRRLRWVNLGYSYHWGTKTYDFSKPYNPVPCVISRLCKSIASELDWHAVWKGCDELDGGFIGKSDWSKWSTDYKPEAGIINFYDIGDSLMGHVDRSEVDSTSPLISISLGRPAIFLIGGQTREVKPFAFLLRSGDVIVMSGPSCRRAYHGIPRIIENEDIPPYLTVSCNDSWWPFYDYIRHSRININVRQVFGDDLSQQLLLDELSEGANAAPPASSQ